MIDVTPTTVPSPVDPETTGLLFRPLELLNSYAPVFLIAFTVTLLATPFVRKIAVKAGIIDMPDRQRKFHAYPVAYLGGLAVFLGVIVSLMAAIFVTCSRSARSAFTTRSCTTGSARRWSRCS